ncbi:Dps family protein [Halalkalibacterium ligniniphilum]|uniref:Dps family protein n=1 Tax=Halalkalibacterium ligniniphilum TaxID=1134413 RepID=UPI00034C4D57|nr:DNA starvation/stationary phase protection protein [Halalkalibacterium ligniniphilum]
MDNKLIELLNTQLANWNVLYTKLHNYHWNVKGPEFFTLHAKFEEYYTQAAANIDQIAERILTINGKPIATMTEYLHYSSVKEGEGTEDAMQMVDAIASDFEKLVEESNQLIEVAEKLGDEATGDMFIQIKGSLEQHIWMLRAFLK